MTGFALLFGLLCVFGGLQSGVFAQDGEKFSYPRALERIESLVGSLNESLHETKEDLQEVRLCLNETKKKLGEVQREKETLEAQLLETKNELSTTKSLYQQEIDDLRATQDSTRVEALEVGLRAVRMKVSDLEDEELPRQLSELNEDLSDVTRDLRRLENENLPRRVNELAIDYHMILTKLVAAEFNHNSTTYKLKDELRQLNSETQKLESKLEAALSSLPDEQLVERVQELTNNYNSLQLKLAEVDVDEEEWESRIAMSRALMELSGNMSDMKHTVTRLNDRVAEHDTTTDRLQQQVSKQESSVSSLSSNIQMQMHTTENLTSTVTEQSVCLADLKQDVEEVKTSARNLSEVQYQQAKRVSELSSDVKQLKCTYPTSCKEVYRCNPAIPSGYYYIWTPQGVERVYCEMNTSNCGDVRGGWMRVAHIDMTDPRQHCPQGLQYIVQPSKRMCVHPYSGSCSSVTFPQHGVPYTKVCGRARGYQYGSPEAFYGYHRYSQSLEGYYVLGLSVTHGTPRRHIWTFVAGVSNDGTFYTNQCPCALPGRAAAPPYVGDNYYCESGWSGGTPWQQWHLDDPLWDSQGCPHGSTCCDRGGPWFNVTLSQEVSDDIEVRWCRYKDVRDYFGVDQLEVFVH